MKVVLAHPEAKLPVRATEQAAGYDLSSVEDAIVPARDKCVINTGIKISVPPHTYGQVCLGRGTSCTPPTRSHAE